MAVVTPTPKTQFIDAAGEPLVGGKLYSYAAGTTTPQPTYTDSTGATANSNPVILDARGEANVWLGEATYKFKLTDANDVEIWTVDYISAPTTSLSPVLSGNVTISSDSSGPALKITQTGTGYVMRVQDSADPDSTPFVINASGYVGLGTTAPAEALDIDNNGKLQFSSSGTALTVISADATNSTIDVKDNRNLVVKTNAATVITANDASVTTTVPVVLPGVPTTSLQAATKSYVDQVTPPGALMAYAAATPPTGWLLCDGSAVSRTTYAALFAVISTTWGTGDGSTTFNVPDLRGQFLRGYDSRATATSKDTTTFAGTTSNGSATISGISSAVTPYLYADMPISGSGVPVGATISTVSSTSITISANATASATVTLTVGRTFAGAQADAYLNHSHTATSTDSGHTHPLYYTNMNGGSTGVYPYPTTSGITQNSVATGNANITTTVATSTTGNVETRPKNYAVLYIIKT